MINERIELNFRKPSPEFPYRILVSGLCWGQPFKGVLLGLRYGSYEVRVSLDTPVLHPEKRFRVHYIDVPAYKGNGFDIRVDGTEPVSEYEIR